MKGGDASDASRLPSLAGHTLDLSETGLTLVVPAIRIGGKYLTDQDCKLRITLELSTGSIQLFAASMRFEQLTGEAEESGYLIGAHITEMRDGDRDRYLEFLRPLAPVERRSLNHREEGRAIFDMNPAKVIK